MKKLCASVTILLVTGLAFAQNNSTITTIGTNNIADVEQDYTSGGVNNSIILQDHGSTIPIMNARAYITQIGGGNLSDLHQYHQGTSSQSNGNNFEATIEQVGQDNESQAYQKNNNHILMVYQQGTGNYQESNQVGNKHTGDISQYGTTNESYLTQSGANNNATVEQHGTSNYSEVNHPDHRASADVYQQGTGNSSIITQYDWYNTSSVEQHGTENESIITQNGGTGSGDPGNNNASVYQSGISYYSIITQVGYSNSADVNQH